MLSSQRDLVQCPSCTASLPYARLNSHLDRCLQDGASSSSTLTSAPAGSSRRSATAPNSTDSPAGVFGSMMMTMGGGANKKRKTIVSEATPQLQEEEAKKASTTIPTGNTTWPTTNLQSATSSAREDKGSPPQSSAPLSSRDYLSSAAPLAERLRPRCLDEYVGQEDIVKGPLAALLKQGRIPSCILWGPPGVGKTTLARLLTREVNQRSIRDVKGQTNTQAQSAAIPPPYRFMELSATTTSTLDLKKIFNTSLSHLQLTGQRTVIFMDEMQRYSRAQQDVFLGPVEKGHVVLVAATTENPSFRLQGALLSRMRVFVLKKLSADEILRLLREARDRVSKEEENMKQEAGGRPSANGIKQEPELDSKGNCLTTSTDVVPESILSYIAKSCDGDARAALQSLEIALSLYDPSLSVSMNLSNLKTSLSRQAFHYDRTGDQHYDTISALHKSIRGSDPDAALYWLARMVAAGDDPLFIARRLIVAASEDVNSLEALQLAVATYQACQVVGLPECGENLAQCVVALAEAPKNTRAYRGWKKALAFVQTEKQYEVPFHIRNAPTKLMKQLGCGREYRYEPRFAHPVYQRFFPEEMTEEKRFLSPPPSPSGEANYAAAHASLLRAQSETSSSGVAAATPTLTATAPAGTLSSVAPSRGRFRPPSPPPSTAEAVAGTAASVSSPRPCSSPSPRVTSAAGPPPLLPTSAAIGPGACQRLFTLNSRVVDLSLLDEWERKRNRGKEWSGRRELENSLWRGIASGMAREIFDLDQGSHAGCEEERDSGSEGDN